MDQFFNSSPAPPPIRSPFAPIDFNTTQWSVVAMAQEGAAPVAKEALATLCQTYWYPLYVYIRKRTNSADEAEELTQEFFSRLVERNFLQSADRSKGSFRAYLLACCKHFLANRRKHARALKRGGGQLIVSLDIDTASQRYLREPADCLTAEKLFDRRWALTLLERTLEELADEYQRQGKKPLYDELKGHLVGRSDCSYATTAARLEMSEAAVKKAAQRLRERCRAIMRKKILETVQSADQLEDEVRSLFAILAG